MTGETGTYGWPCRLGGLAISAESALRASTAGAETPTTAAADGVGSRWLGERTGVLEGMGEARLEVEAFSTAS